MWSRFKKKVLKSGKPPAGLASPLPVTAPEPARAEPAATGAGGSTSVPYRPELVDKLVADHRELFRLYHRLNDAVQRKQPDSIPGDLVNFRRAFQGHILVENVSFYVYLERILAESAEELGYVRSLRKDMNGIAKTVSDFIEVWLKEPPVPATLAAFGEQLSAIGRALVARVELEENSLYVLYVESRA